MAETAGWRRAADHDSVRHTGGVTGPELVLDESEWPYRMRGHDPYRSGRLRAWRDADGRLVAMVTMRVHSLHDDGCLLPGQVRARFPDEEVEVIAYEPGSWADFAHYYRATAGEGCWEEINGTILVERLSPIFVFDDEADPRGGSDPDF